LLDSKENFSRWSQFLRYHLKAKTYDRDKEQTGRSPGKKPDRQAEPGSQHETDRVTVLRNQEASHRSRAARQRVRPAGGGFGGGYTSYQDMDINDIFSHFSDIFGDMGGRSRSRGRSSAAAGVRGSNLRIRVKVTLPEIAKGVEKTIKIARLVHSKDTTFKTCPTCGGSGQTVRVQNTPFGAMQTVSECPTCQGTGKVIDKRGAGANAEGLVNQEETISVKNREWYLLYLIYIIQSIVFMARHL